jgi:hypothetical protein
MGLSADENALTSLQETYRVELRIWGITHRCTSVIVKAAAIASENPDKPSTTMPSSLDIKCCDQLNIIIEVKLLKFIGCLLV